MLKAIKPILFFLFLTVITFIVNAQSPFFKIQQFFKNKPTCAVKLFYQDSQGYLWIYTSEGLIKFNGLEYTTFAAKDSIDPSPITAMTEDNQKRLWIGHKNGLLEYLDNNYFVDFKPEEGMGTAEISSMLFDTE